MLTIHELIAMKHELNMMLFKHLITANDWWIQIKLLEYFA